MKSAYIKIRVTNVASKQNKNMSSGWDRGHIMSKLKSACKLLNFNLNPKACKEGRLWVGQWKGQGPKKVKEKINMLT